MPSSQSLKSGGKKVTLGHLELFYASICPVSHLLELISREPGYKMKETLLQKQCLPVLKGTY